MNSLFRSVVTLRGRESRIKESLMQQLMSSVKEVQLEHAQNGGTDAQTINETTSSLCTILEAIMIHGLKETLINRMSSVIGTDPDQRPEPNFWAPVLVVSHREIIDQINGLTQVSTDVGRCRVWLRMALNDNLLSSYFHAMNQEKDSVSTYYKRTAFLQDGEFIDMTRKLLEGVESCTFALACNSSLLNVWTNEPLLLAGLWSPPLKSCPVTSGTDIAKTLSLNYDSSREDSLFSAISLSSGPDSVSGTSPALPFNEEEAFKIILGTPIVSSILQEGLGSEAEDSVSDDDSRWNKVENQENFTSSNYGVNKTPDDPNVTGEMSTEITESVVHSKPLESNVDNETNYKAHLPSQISVETAQSYCSLLKSYNTVAGPHTKAPDLKDFMQRFETRPNRTILLANNVPSITDDPEQLTALSSMGYEVIPHSPSGLFTTSEFSRLIHQLGRLATESGLATQYFSCKDCEQPIGVHFREARVCNLTKCYYCTECFGCNDWLIPARVVHNWDFRRYPVSSRAATFLSEVQYNPLLDIRLINPRIYTAVEDMAELRKLRMRLNYLQAYLLTCHQPVMEELQKQIWPRDYLYEHVHLYSIVDLREILSRALPQLLKKVVQFAHSHVLSCRLCSQKGFICEVCDDCEIIYPFDMESTYRCGVCSSVFHIGCLNVSKPCPKCKRLCTRQKS